MMNSGIVSSVLPRTAITAETLLTTHNKPEVYASRLKIENSIGVILYGWPWRLDAISQRLA